MRITNNMLSRNLLRNLESAQGRMDALQNQMSSGHRITKPSDDPVGVENALKMKSSVTMVEQWEKNADEALTYMNTTDSTLADVGSLLQRVRELTIQGANGPLNGDAREAIAQEIDQISAQLKTIANTKVGSKYIFGGTATNTEPMSLTGWVGNSNPIQFDVGNSAKVDVTVRGDSLFVNPGSELLTNGAAVPVPAIGILEKLSADLRTGTTQDISANLNGIDKNINNVIALRSGLGARINRMQTIRDQLSSTSVNLQANLSSIQDADMAKTITDFTNQQNVYRAALSVGAQIIQPSLVDYIK